MLELQPPQKSNVSICLIHSSTQFDFTCEDHAIREIIYIEVLNSSVCTQIQDPTQAIRNSSPPLNLSISHPRIHRLIHLFFFEGMN